MSNFRRGMHLVLLGLMMAVCMVASAGQGRGDAEQALAVQRGKIIREWVGDFKVGLIDRVERYPELQGMETVDYDESSLLFVNDRVQPRVRISLSVQDTSRSGKQATEPASGADHLPDVDIACALDLECEGRDALRAEVRRLYERFKICLQRDLAWLQTQRAVDDRGGVAFDRLYSLAWVAFLVAVLWFIIRATKRQKDAEAAVKQSMELQRQGLEMARESIEINRQIVQTEQAILDELRKK